jgi:hypothetical protein
LRPSFLGAVVAMFGNIYVPPAARRMTVSMLASLFTGPKHRVGSVTYVVHSFHSRGQARPCLFEDRPGWKTWGGKLGSRKF